MSFSDKKIVRGNVKDFVQGLQKIKDSFKSKDMLSEQDALTFLKDMYANKNN